MYKVYWTTNTGAVQGQEIEDLSIALKKTQELRNDHAITFVTITGQDSSCTSKQGAAMMKAEDYHWKKRRI